MQNPFTHRSTIRNPDMFFGRKQILARILPLLANTQSISIIGERRIGKSSLLYGLSLPQIHTRIASANFANFSFVYIDLQGSGHRNADQFLQYLLNALNRLDDAWQLQVDAAFPVQEQFEDVVRQINEQGFKLIFLFDEFDYVVRNERLDAELFSFLRYMANNFEMAIATASQRPLSELCHTEIVDSPFFNIFAQENLPPLTRQEAQDLIITPSTLVGYSLEQEVDWILALTGRQPMFIQIACFIIVAALSFSDEDGDLDYAEIENQFRSEVRQHLAYTWDHLSDHLRQTCIKASLQDHGPYEYYLLESAAFRQFIREQAGHQIPKTALITVAAVKDALRHLWRADELAKSPLIELDLVQHQTEQPEFNQAQSLRAILRTAIGLLAQTAGNDRQSQEWRHWFILDKSYVHRENNAALARQLSVAERTFYRERDDAINALITILQTMETTVLSE